MAEVNPPFYICHVAEENPLIWIVRQVELVHVFLKKILHHYTLTTDKKKKRLPNQKT
jgi:hypothetical protein